MFLKPLIVLGCSIFCAFSLLFAQTVPGADSLVTQTVSGADSIDALSALRQAAMKAGSASTETVEVQEQSFVEKSRSLQAANPEISVVGDALSIYNDTQNDAYEPGISYRVLGVHLQSTLDPFSLAKAAVELTPEGVELAEAYLTWTNPLPRTSLTFGKFRQQFGVINRWHEHALDQTFLPLPLQTYMGEEGLVGTGVSGHLILPSLIAQANELTVQVTNSDNEELYNGNHSHIPSILLHWNNYYDMSQNTYFEWGLSSVTGANDSLGFTFRDNHRWTTLNGLDITVSWNPTNRSLYHNFSWRNEILQLTKARYDGETIQALGAYTYLNYQYNRSLIFGLRFDYVQDPDLTENYQWQFVPYLTFIQSEFVYFRLEVPTRHFSTGEPAQTAVLLQIDWAAGPHKHDKY